MNGLNYIGTTSHPQINQGQAIPLYSMDGFINTLAGNNMQALDRNNYPRTREIWDSLKTAQERKAFECTVLEYLEEIKKVPSELQFQRHQVSKHK